MEVAKILLDAGASPATLNRYKQLDTQQLLTYVCFETFFLLTNSLTDLSTLQCSHSNTPVDEALGKPYQDEMLALIRNYQQPDKADLEEHQQLDTADTEEDICEVKTE